MKPDKTLPLYFSLFNEIGIIDQLATTMFQKRLPNGLLVNHFSVLNHLIRVEDGRTPLALASAFQVPKTTMTHTLGGLERFGFVDLRPNPKDGRSKLVWITPAGRVFRDEAIAAMAGDFGIMMREFDEDYVRDLVPKLERLRVFLDELRNT